MSVTFVSIFVILFCGCFSKSKETRAKCEDTSDKCVQSDIAKWLIDNRLDKYVEIFETRNVIMDDLESFTDEEINAIIEGYGMDTFDKHKFIKGIKILRNRCINIFENLKVRYEASKFNFDDKMLYDSSPNKYYNATITGNINKHGQYGFIYGSYNDGFDIPYPMHTESSTFIYLAKYNGQHKERIIGISSNSADDYLVGFHVGNAGVCYQNVWITTEKNRFPHDAWLLSIAQPGHYRANGISSFKSASFTHGNIFLSVNADVRYVNQKSDWAIHEIMIFDRIIDAKQYKCIEKYFMDTYPLLSVKID